MALRAYFQHKLISDYNFTIDYHPDRANVVTDAFNHKSYGQLSSLIKAYTPNFLELRKTGIQLKMRVYRALIAHSQVQPILVIKFARLSKVIYYVKD